MTPEDAEQWCQRTSSTLPPAGEQWTGAGVTEQQWGGAQGLVVKPVVLKVGFLGTCQKHRIIPHLTLLRQRFGGFINRD